MPNPSRTLQNEEFVLQNVIQTLVDSQEGFKTIGEALQDESLKTYFLGESIQQASFRGDLESALHQEGVHDIPAHGTVNGTLLRAWGSLKNKLGGGDHALLSTAAEAARDAVQAYTDALEHDLPLPIRQMLVSQGVHAEAVCDFVKIALEAHSG